MTLYWFLLVVSSLAIGSIPAEPVQWTHCVLATVMLVTAWVMLTQTVSSMTRRAVSTGFDPLAAARLLERQLDILRWLGLPVTALCWVGFGLAPAVRTWPLFESSMTLQSLVLLTPGLVITASVWLSEHRYGVALGYAEAGCWRATREMAKALVATGGWILAPVLAMLVATDVVRLSGWFNEQTAAAMIAVVAVVGVPIAVPLIVRRIWTTRPIDEVHRQWTEPLLASVGMKPLPIKVWDTGMRSYNAVVAGFLPGLRSMIVTDRLFQEMAPRELSLVLLHEIAHIRHGHVWIRMLAMVPSWIAAAAISSSFSSSSLVTVATNLAAVATTLVTLRWVAHATERDADRTACRLAMQLPIELDPPRSEQDAADRFCQALRWVTRNERSPEKSSWLHPSVDDRCAHLQNWVRLSPGFEHPVDDAGRCLAVTVGIDR
ncbi:MAG: M48 family metalloprotease [Planctomycetaceae bacterium]